ncbi:MAG: UvrB/UvrC motif-containing protein, partial [Candidatus Delongbacteria bacterium]|nr:UvrB/UvrC motif-containing protein [Candidatus Delongbacteria bacterium]
KVQEEYNLRNNITPKTIYKSSEEILKQTQMGKYETAAQVKEKKAEYKEIKEAKNEIIELDALMIEAAENLEFERAAEYRDRIRVLEGLIEEKI